MNRGEAVKILCPSMMCACYDSLQDEVRQLDLAGADRFHIDIMDGRFVPNFGMGAQDLTCIRAHTQKKIDVHLMIEEPGGYVALFAELGADILYIHPETDRHPAGTLGKIRSLGKAAGLALSPGISVEQIEELLPLVDDVMVMTVVPGFAGQPYLDFVERKIARVAALKSTYGFRLHADGALSPEHIKRLAALGVDGFVLGTSALFGKQESYEALMGRLKRQN